MPIGYLVTTGLIATCTLLALAPPRPRRSSPSNPSFWFGFLINELPFVAFYSLWPRPCGPRSGGSQIARWVVGFALAVLATAGSRSSPGAVMRARSTVERALSNGLGAGWRSALDADLAARLRCRLPFAKILLGPFFFRRRDVERVTKSEYGDAGSGVASISTAIAPTPPPHPSSSTSTVAR